MSTMQLGSTVARMTVLLTEIWRPLNDVCSVTDTLYHRLQLWRGVHRNVTSA